MTVVEAFAKTMNSEFGAQVGALTVAFLAFIGWSSTSLNSDFWTTPF